MRAFQSTEPAPQSEPGTGRAAELSAEDKVIIDQVRPYTMTSTERICATIDAVDYAVRRGIPGALVECGVWRGGSVLAMIKTLQRHGVSDRDIYLFDTFTGMTEPTAEDVSPFDEPALVTWNQSSDRNDQPWSWAFRPDVFGLDDVRGLLLDTGFPEDRLHFVVGPVEDTLPENAPDDVAVLRLDTDWYQSTLHELTHLYPRISAGGALIIDDYGHWLGARKAVDEYFEGEAPPILLNRIDYTGRIGIKI